MIISLKNEHLSVGERSESDQQTLVITPAQKQKTVKQIEKQKFKTPKTNRPDYVISLFEFCEFINSPAQRQALAWQVFNRAPYEVIKDRYVKMRKKISSFFKGQSNINDLKDIAVSAHKTKAPSFMLLVKNIEEFIVGKKIAWFEPPTYPILYDNIRLSINPELGLVIDGHKYIIKCYFKKDPLNIKIKNQVISIMKLSFDIDIDDYSFAVWDIQANDFYSDNSIIKADKLTVLTVMSEFNKYK